MNAIPPIYTITMAELLEKQGKYTQALSIYRRLLADNPEQKDLMDAVYRLEKRSGNRMSTDMIATFEIWIDLLCRAGHLAQLKNVNKALNQKPRELSNDDNG